MKAIFYILISALLSFNCIAQDCKVEDDPFTGAKTVTFDFKNKSVFYSLIDGKARVETMFDKPSFKASARQQRGIIVLDSFYEHHHFNGRVYPFNIKRKDGDALIMAVLWSEWVDKQSGELLKTFSIVTTAGNELMSVIHNNPKKKDARMPVILEGEEINDWLGTPASDDNHLTLIPLCKPLQKDALEAHAVRTLRGKNAVGNVPTATEAFEYPELVFDTELMEVLT